MSVQALCDRLVADDAALTELRIILDNVDDAEVKLILETARRNETVKRVRLVGSYYGGSLGVPAALSLASVVSEHTGIQEIDFYMVKFIEFGPIALAIQQNRNLTRLRLERCRVTPNLLECVRWLLTENALERMTLQNNLNDGSPPFDMSCALLANSSLKELVLHDYGDVFGLETLQAIPRFIRTNQAFETVDLSLSDTVTDRHAVVRLVAQATEGHASLNKLAINYPYKSDKEPHSAEDAINDDGTVEAIGTMLHNAPALRELSLTGFYMGSAGHRHLADGLSCKNSVIEKLDLSRNRIGDEEAGIFARVLLANQNLKSLVLNANIIGDTGALDLAVALRQNTTLELFFLKWNQIGSDGASAIADSLVANDAMKSLNLHDNPIGDDGATSIAEMLTRNESIEKICIGEFGEEGLKAFATCLSSMKGLKSLGVDNHETSCYTSKIGRYFVLALEQNMTLETIDFDAMRSDFRVRPKVNRLLALNRGGRQLLSATGESVPPLNYWPCILARSSSNADVLFHFLREIPNVLVEKASSRKRQRGHHE